MYRFLFLTLFLYSPLSHAQIATSSIFKEMRSENPAVISKRPAATFSALAKADRVDKTQAVDGTTITKSTSEIDINTYSFFYGGAGGKGITTEINGEIGDGTKKDIVETSGSSANVTTQADLMMLNVQMSLFDFLGIGIMRATEDRTQTSVSGSSNGVYETTLTPISVGMTFDMGVKIGFFGQNAKFEQTGTFAGESFSTNIDFKRVGVGIGLGGTKGSHFEIGYIMDLDEVEEDQGGGTGAGQNVVVYKPAKAIASVEFQMGGMTLGLTSSYYMDGYFDFNNIVYYTMVLSSNKENRLENAINFSFGGDKGGSFSGSASYSTVESQELPATLSSGTSYTTETKLVSAQVSYSYAF